jgi:formylmethanofuran dehydrogenase subunit B
MVANHFSVIENFACMACACVCDDLRVTVADDRIARAEGACRLAEPWLVSRNTVDEPVCEIQQQPVPLEKALDRAAQILQAADYPLIYGLSQCTTEGQRASVLLAERLGAVIDTSASVCHAPSVVAQQLVGKVTCTLGEIRNRADCIIFWGSDPLVSHPRHTERYSIHAKGRFLPRGRSDRFVVVADTTRTASAAEADLFVPIEPGRHFEALSELRARLLGVQPDGRIPAGSPSPAMAELIDRMKRAKYGAFLFGVDLARGEAGHCNVAALLQLVADLNGGARWCAMRMRVQGNVVGADSVLAWQTGYPFAVNMARGYPRYNPGEYSVHSILERKEADACLIVGSETLGWFSAEALEYLRQIRTVVLDAPGATVAVDPEVRFRIATAGIDEAGTVYRMDGVPIPVKAVLYAHYPTAAQILRDISSRLP